MQECFGFQTFLNSFLVAVEFLAPGVIVCVFVGGGQNCWFGGQRKFGQEVKHMSLSPPIPPIKTVH